MSETPIAIKWDKYLKGEADVDTIIGQSKFFIVEYGDYEYDTCICCFIGKVTETNYEGYSLRVSYQCGRGYYLDVIPFVKSDTTFDFDILTQNITAPLEKMKTLIERLNPKKLVAE